MKYLAKIDRTIQRGVDRAVIWLIQHGVAKSLTMYAVTCLGIASMMTKSAIEGKLSGIIASACFSAAGVVQAERFRRMDERAEARPGVMSEADISRSIIKHPWWKAWTALAGLIFPWGYPLPLATLTLFMWTCFLLQCYIAAAPRTAPPRKRQVPIGAAQETAA